MLYCFVENELISDPQPLPINYRNISNFYLLDEEILNSFGFFRFVSTIIPSYNSNSEKIVETLVLNDNLVTYNYEVVPLSPEELYEHVTNMKFFFVALIEDFLNTTVRVKDYKDILHACSYINSSIPSYQQESQAVIHWRDLVWVKAYEVQNAIANGERAIPTQEEFMAELPVLVWPE